MKSYINRLSVSLSKQRFFGIKKNDGLNLSVKSVFSAQALIRDTVQKSILKPVLRKGENLSTAGQENSWSRVSNQQPQPSCDDKSGYRIRATKVRGKRSYQSAGPALFICSPARRNSRPATHN